jgi:hypothetical protein
MIEPNKCEECGCDLEEDEFGLCEDCIDADDWADEDEEDEEEH